MVFFISPPFGNYFSLPNTISITGSYTLDERGGLYTQIIKTFRYSFKYGGWLNQIGLRNRGIDYAIKTYNKNSITSIAILKEKEIPKILNKIPEDMNIEINISCPNTDEALISSGIKQFLNPKRDWCIIKLSPLVKTEEIDHHYNNGFRQFHCSNTLPVENKGGLSGPSLIPHTLNSIKKIKQKYPDTTVIAGGGIRDTATAELYKKNGADYVSVSTLCLNPVLFCYFYLKINQN